MSVLHYLKSIDATLKRMERKMTSQADLDAAVALLEGDEADLAKQMNDAFARLQAKIDAGASGPDLTAEVQRLAALHAQNMALSSGAAAEAPAATDTPPPAV